MAVSSPSGRVGEAGQKAHAFGSQRQPSGVDGAAPFVEPVAAPVEHQRYRLQDDHLAQQVLLAHRLEIDEPAGVLEAAAGQQFQKLIAADRSCRIASRCRQGGPGPERSARCAQCAGMGEVIAGQRGAGVGGAGEQDAAALLIGLGGGQRRRIVDHGDGEIARQLDRRTQFRFVREGAPVEQITGFEIGGVERIAAPAERGILPGPRAVAIGTRQALEAGRVAGGSARIGNGGAVARDTSCLCVGGSPIGAFGRLPCRS